MMIMMIIVIITTTTTTTTTITTTTIITMHDDVSQLRLDDTSLSGTLPEEIAMLLELSELDVASSYFSGRSLTPR